MASIIINGDTSGAITLSAPSVAGSNTLTLPAITDTLVGAAATQTLTNKTLGTPLTMAATPLTSGSNTATTSGTSQEFTGIPSWVQQITVMFSGVSTNGTNIPQLQLGSTTYTTSGYTGYTAYSNIVTAHSSGFLLSTSSAATYTVTGHAVLRYLSGNNWVFSTNCFNVGINNTFHGSGIVTLAGTLDRVRITSVGTTDTLDAGFINIFYE